MLEARVWPKYWRRRQNLVTIAATMDTRSAHGDLSRRFATSTGAAISNEPRDMTSKCVANIVSTRIVDKLLHAVTLNFKFSSFRCYASYRLDSIDYRRQIFFYSILYIIALCIILCTILLHITYIFIYIICNVQFK